MPYAAPVSGYPRRLGLPRRVRPGHRTGDHTHPAAPATGNDPNQGTQELQVRLTAQRILHDHLQPGTSPTPPRWSKWRRRRKPTNPKFWPDLDLDLSNATLTDFDLTQCRIRQGQFAGATFTGGAWFAGATFTGGAGFRGATFSRDAWFDDATFTETAGFDDATFTGTAWFGEARARVGPAHAWPAGWRLRPDPDHPGWAVLEPGVTW
jgi:hypothetical protein